MYLEVFKLMTYFRIYMDILFITNIGWDVEYCFYIYEVFLMEIYIEMRTGENKIFKLQNKILYIIYIIS